MLLMVKSVAVWVLILGLAFTNAGLRELVLIPRYGRVAALGLSGSILCVLVLLIAWGTLPWIGARRPSELAAVGFGLLVLTVAFEWALSWAHGKPVHAMLEAYRFKDGNLWPLVLAVTAMAPWLVARLRGW